MDQLNGRLLKRTCLSRNRSLLAAEERDDSEIASLNLSLERSISPKFLKPSVAIHTAAPKLMKPSSIKLQQKLLPTALARLYKENSSFQAQLESLRCFTSPGSAAHQKATLNTDPPYAEHIPSQVNPSRTCLRASKAKKHRPSTDMSITEAPYNCGSRNSGIEIGHHTLLNKGRNTADNSTNSLQLTWKLKLEKNETPTSIGRKRAGSHQIDCSNATLKCPHLSPGTPSLNSSTLRPILKKVNLKALHRMTTERTAGSSKSAAKRVKILSKAELCS